MRGGSSTRTGSKALHWDVLEQDRVVLEAMADDAREHEFLYQHDTGLSRVRRRLRELAASSLRRLRRCGGRQRGGAMIALAGKRILVTGAARGLGRAFAERRPRRRRAGGARRCARRARPRRRRRRSRRRGEAAFVRDRPRRSGLDRARASPRRPSGSAGSTGSSTTRRSPPASAARPSRRSTSRPGTG